jgi:vacuolar-type H+-ATPase subunit E/Vma4
VKGLGSIEAVVAAIQEDVRAEIERIDADAAAQIAAMREADAIQPIVVADAETRRATARRRVRDRIGAEDWADRQAALTARERWMSRVVEEALRRLAALEPEARARDLATLACEAIRRLPDGPCELLLSTEDAALADEAWRAGVAAACGREVQVNVERAGFESGGCVAQVPGGRIRFDNTYAARMRRAETRWRAALGEIFDRAAAAAAPEPAGSQR